MMKDASSGGEAWQTASTYLLMPHGGAGMVMPLGALIPRSGCSCPFYYLSMCSLADGVSDAYQHRVVVTLDDGQLSSSLPIWCWA